MTAGVSFYKVVASRPLKKRKNVIVRAITLLFKKKPLQNPKICSTWFSYKTCSRIFPAHHRERLVLLFLSLSFLLPFSVQIFEFSGKSCQWLLLIFWFFNTPSTTVLLHGHSTVTFRHFLGGFHSAPPLSAHRHRYGLAQVPTPDLKSVKLPWRLWQPFVGWAYIGEGIKGSVG